MSMKDRNNWASIFMKATIVQMMLASALTIYLLVGIIGPLRLLAFLISYNVSDGPFAGAWFNFGYFAYLIGVLAIGMMKMIYRHFEHTLHIGYDRATRVLAALNFVFMNVGIIIATWPMMIAGYIGGVSQMSSVWGGKGITAIQVHHTIFVPYGVEIFVAVGSRINITSTTPLFVPYGVEIFVAVGSRINITSTTPSTSDPLVLVLLNPAFPNS